MRLTLVPSAGRGIPAGARGHSLVEWKDQALGGVRVQCEEVV